MAEFPIALRTRNRPVFLDVTLQSIMASDLPLDANVVILDDCSDDPLAVKYLFTNEVIRLPQPLTWPPVAPWANRVGSIAPVRQLRGIASRYEVVQPAKRRGVRGGIFWCIDYMMTRFPKSEAVIVIEADAVFNRYWYKALSQVYPLCKNAPGPNGDHLGLLTCYDRRGGTVAGLDPAHPPLNLWGWRSVSLRGNGNWNCGNGIGGVVYVVTRAFYEADVNAMQRQYGVHERGGDTTLQGHCGAHNFTIATTSPSYCQHIGFESLAWPEKGWRHCKNFLKPMAFPGTDEAGRFCSPDWEA